MAGFTRWVSLVSEPATKLQRRHRYGAQVGFDFFTQAPVRLRQMQQAQGCGLVVGYLLPLALTSSPTLALRVTGGGFPLLGDSCSRSTGFLLHRAA